MEDQAGEASDNQLSNATLLRELDDLLIDYYDNILHGSHDIDLEYYEDLFYDAIDDFYERLNIPEKLHAQFEIDLKKRLRRRIFKNNNGGNN